MIEKLKAQLESHYPKTKSPLNQNLIPSSVIVLIIKIDSIYKILLNKRTNNVHDHKGEISFPGGRQDKDDLDILSTGLREFEEEMGISYSKIDIIGRLSDVVTSSNYLITPYVATAYSKLNFSPNPEEVDLIIEVPIKELRKYDNLRSEIRVTNDKPIKYTCYSYQGNLIWGATARILTELLTMVEYE